MAMTDDLRKDLLAIVLEEAFDYDQARIRNWLAGRFDQNDCVTDSDISALQTESLIIDRIESRCSQELAPTKSGRAQRLPTREAAVEEIVDRLDGCIDPDQIGRVQ